MTAIAVYLLFVAALSGYRTSVYWPKNISAVPWLGNQGWNWGCTLSGLTLFIMDKGWTTGILLALCSYMVVLSGLIFFIACNLKIRLLVLILFHVLCLSGLIIKF